MTTRFTQSFIHNTITMATYIPTSSKRLASLLAICLLGISSMAFAQTVTVMPEGAGTYTITDQNSMTFKLEAIPNSGYYFLHWEKRGTKVSELNPFDTAVGDYTAVFAPLPEMVDLGFPSNIRWASCNVGATMPEEEGQRFAWGEITPKQSFTVDNYNPLTDVSPLGLAYDAAAQRLGNGWHMPSYADLQRLLNSTYYTWEYDMEKRGYNVINKANPSQFIFLPSPAGTAYWSNVAVANSDQAGAVLFNDEGREGTLSYKERHLGALVRPVRSPYTITISAESAIGLGEVEVNTVMTDVINSSISSYGATGIQYYGNKITIKVEAANELEGFVSWSDGNTDNPRTIVVTKDITLKALFANESAGAALAPVDLGLPSGIRWSQVNLSAIGQGVGKYFAAGETTKKDDGYTLDNYTVENYTAGVQFDANHDAAANIWGSNWRTPTSEELKELLSCAKEEVMEDGVLTGYTFKGSNGYSIFLPVTGYAEGDGKVNTAQGYYMSSTIASNVTEVDILHFTEGAAGMSALARYLGQVIRPVHVKKMVDITVKANDATRGNVTGSTRCVESTNVEITAEANTGYTFVRWNDDVIEPVRTVSVNQHTTYTAIFEPNDCQIKATLIVPHGSSTIAITSDNETISSGGTVQHGKDVTVAVTKDPAYEIVRWMVDDEELKDAEGETYTDLEYEFTAHDNTTITVEMKESIVTLPTFLKENEQGGTVTIANEQGVSKPENKYTYGEEVLLTAQPKIEQGYTFTGWKSTISDEIESTENPRRIIVGDDNTDFIAVFTLKTYDLSAWRAENATLGTITMVNQDGETGPIFNYGDVVTITFIPQGENVDFIMWTDNAKTKSNEINVEMKGDNPVNFKVVATRLVDLGTSVLWSQINVGATTPLEAGDYFAWGNTSPIEVSKTYETGIAELPLEYDAANFNWGGKWQSPTADEWNELMDGTKCRWIQKQTEAGVSYWRVENKDDSNEYIELSLCGIKRPAENNPSFVNTWGDYSTANTSDNAKVQYVRLQKTSYGVFAGGGPDVGRVVRPIHPRDEVYTITATSNDENKGTVTGGGEYPKNKMITLIATPKPTYRFKQWNDGSTDNPREINVTTNKDYTAEFETIVPIEPSYVDLGLPSGVLWATFNLGAESAISSGNYFAWGEVHPYMKNTYQDPGNMDDMDVLAPEYDAARVNWGGDWRIPTKTEMDELKQNCEWEYVTEDGVPCYRFTSNKNNNSILLPAYGYNKNDIIDRASSDYLSSSADAGKKIRYLRMTITSNPDAGVVSVTQGGSRDIGRLIRPVITGVIITVNADGEGTVTGGGSYVAGTKVTIAATPADGYYFKHWQGTNNTDASFDITVETAQTYTAVFAPIDDTVDETIVNATVNEDATAAIIPAKDGYTVLKVIDAEGNTLANAANVAASAFTGCEIVTAYYTSATQNYAQYVRMPLIYDNTSDEHVSDCNCDVHIKDVTLTVSSEKANNSLTLHGTGSLVITPAGALTLGTTITGATATDDVQIQASAAGNGVLIMKGYTSGAERVHATVQIYAPQISNNPATRWNAIGVPAAVDGVTYFSGSWVYRLQHEDKSWVAMKRGTLDSFTGYLVTQKDNPKTYNVSCALEDNTSRTLNLVYAPGLAGVDPHQQTATLFANSWTAPIPIKDLTEENFSADVEQTICLVEKGNYQEYTWMEHDGRSIMSMEAFFVAAKTPGDGKTITLNYADHVVGSTNAPKRLARAYDDLDDRTALRIYVNAGEDLTDKILLVQSEQYTPAFDNGADATKMMSGGFPNIAVQSKDTELGIYATNSLDSTLLNFYKAEADTYTLSFEYDGSDELILKDFYIGSTCDINATSTYTFEATGNDMGRFAIFKKPEMGETVTNLLNVWVSNDMLVFSNPAGERATVAIYSADGKLVQTITTAETMTEINVPAQGVYFIQLTTPTTTQTIKQIF